MNRVALFFLVLICSAFSGDQDGRQEFYVGDGKYVEVLEFKFESPTGYSKLSAVDNPDLGKFYGKFDNTKLTANFKKHNSRGVKKAHLAIVDKHNNHDVNDALNSYSRVQNEWELYLAKKKKHKIELKYGSGNAHINLSELAIQKLSIDNSNASIVIDYEAEQPNVMEMDSMLLKVNKGYLRVNKAYYTKSKYCEIRVKYGTVSMDLSHKLLSESKIFAKVGNGTLRFDLPPEKSPIKISVKGGKFKLSDLPADFRKLSDGVYVNTSYYVNAPRSLEIEVNLAYGNLLFKRTASNK